MSEPNYHDLFFKELMTRQESVSDFLKLYLPPELSAPIDPDSVELRPGSFVDEDLRDHHSDLLYEVKLKRGTTALVYLLFEHKSYPDAWVAWQILKYLVRIWEMEVRGKARKLTPILPIVFYHGSRQWRVALEFSSLMSWDGCEEWKAYSPDFQYHLHDLSQWDDAAVKGNLLTRLGTLALKHIFDEKLDGVWEQFAELLKREPDTKAFDYLLIVLRYVAGVREPATEMQIKNLLIATNPAKSEEVMETLAQVWEQRGLERGWERGLEQGLEKGLEQGLEKGLEQGLEKGLLQGKLQATRELVSRFLRSRFGEGSDELRVKVESLSLERLESLSAAIFDFSSRAELEDWLNAHSG